MNLNKLHDILLDNSKNPDVDKLTKLLEKEITSNNPYDHSNDDIQKAFGIKLNDSDFPKFSGTRLSEFGQTLEEFYTKREITFMFTSLFDTFTKSLK